MNTQVVVFVSFRKSASLQGEVCKQEVYITVCRCLRLVKYCLDYILVDGSVAALGKGKSKGKIDTVCMKRRGSGGIAPLSISLGTG